MEKRRDQEIKLFGKMIFLQGIDEEDSIDAEEEENKLQQRVQEKQPTFQSISPEKVDPIIPLPTKSESGAKPEAKGVAAAAAAAAAEEDEKEGEGTENEEQRKPNGDHEEEETAAAAAKRPDKIVPCPRCDSLDTKFCYFNNYNAGQPRHFCKSCQRYWTAGGSLRNVPVGAGRRKASSKPISPCCYRRPANSSPAHHPSTAVLSFGSDCPLHEFESAASSVLNLAPESCEDQNSSRSSVTGSSSTTDDDGAGTASAAHREAAAAAQIPCVNGFPWAYPMNPAASASAAFAFPLYPAVAYWGYTVPFHPPQCNSPAALGKHAREEGGDDDKSCDEKRFWIPKTLRIDGPEEAARSSIWATIGFKNQKSSAVCGGGLFKPFRSKDDYGMKSACEMPRVLQANPAAFARSINFRESS